MQRWNKRAASVLLCAGVSAASHTARAEIEIGCTRELVLSLVRSYACQRLMNFYALKEDNPSAMVVRVRGNPFTVTFTSRSDDSICGSISLEPGRVEAKVDGGEPREGLRLQAAIDRVFNRLDVDIQRETTVLADAIISTDQSQPSQPSLQRLEAIIAEFEGVVRDEIKATLSKQPLQHSEDRCAILTAGMPVRLPRATGPDISAIRRHANANLSYENFLDWLAASAKPGEITRSP